MSIMGRRVPVHMIAAVAVLLITVVGLLPVMTKDRAREITLVAKDMAFYLDGDPENANPVIELKAGETVRIVLRNRDRGMTHDFAVPDLNAAMKPLDWNEEEDLTFDAPTDAGTYDYVCRPHLMMMKGKIRVTR
jgi:plastocyanin